MAGGARRGSPRSGDVSGQSSSTAPAAPASSSSNAPASSSAVPARPASAPSPPPLGALLAISALLGFAAMGHEALWARLGRTWLGGDARALAASLAAVLLGMAAGARLAPRLARRVGPLVALARLELAAALWRSVQRMHH